MYKKVLLAYDGSVEGRRALREGAKLAQLCRSEVFLLAVVEVSSIMTPEAGLTIPIELQTEDYTEPPQHYFGVPAVGVRNADALEQAVTKALSAKGPTVIEAVVDSDHYVDTVYD